VWTPLNIADKDAKEVAKHGEDTPMKRPASTPKEVAPAYVFFASDADSSYITGEVLTLLVRRDNGVHRVPLLHCMPPKNEGFIECRDQLD
jgi:NAD(P)-dependent dehydrogenase (short-subunit alcohol dehydrogenase family)